MEANRGVKVPIHHLKYTQVKLKIYTIFKLLKTITDKERLLDYCNVSICNLLLHTPAHKSASVHINYKQGKVIFCIDYITKIWKTYKTEKVRSIV